MTKVQIFTHNGQYRSLAFRGHTGYAEEGADIVCAGVSAIVINTVNCLEDLLHEDIELEYDEEEGGDLTCNILTDLSEKGSFLVDSMIYGLKWIQSQYGEEYLRYEIKEV